MLCICVIFVCCPASVLTIRSEYRAPLIEPVNITVKDVNDPHKLLTLDEAASVLGFDRDGHKQPAQAVRYLCQTGRIKDLKVGKRIKLRCRWIDEFVDREATDVVPERPRPRLH